MSQTPVHRRSASTPVVAPSLGPTVLVTCLFGVFGLIPAHFAAKKAAELGLHGTRYHEAFRITLGVVTALIVLLGICCSIATTQ